MHSLSLTGVAFLLEKNGKILVGKRSMERDFGGGWWEIPSGRMDKGEDIQTSLLREAKEELSITITSYSLIDAYDFLRKDSRLVMLTYLCRYEGEIIKSHEHSELRWTSPQEAKILFQFPQQKSTIDNYLRLRSCIDL